MSSEKVRNIACAVVLALLAVVAVLLSVAIALDEAWFEFRCACIREKDLDEVEPDFRRAFDEQWTRKGVNYLCASIKCSYRECGFGGVTVSASDFYMNGYCDLELIRRLAPIATGLCSAGIGVSALLAAAYAVFLVKKNRPLRIPRTVAKVGQVILVLVLICLSVATWILVSKLECPFLVGGDTLGSVDVKPKEAAYLTSVSSGLALVACVVALVLVGPPPEPPAPNAVQPPPVYPPVTQSPLAALPRTGREARQLYEMDQRGYH